MRTSNGYLAWFLVLSSVIWGCGGETGTEPPEEETISPTASLYLTAALDIMEENSINRYQIDWPPFRAEAFSVAGTAQSTSDTYDAIRYALQQLGDHHSFFRPPGGQSQQFLGPDPMQTGPSATHLGAGIGYVNVSTFSGSGALAAELAQNYHTMIEGVDTLGTCGWVVDLRGNLGGNMWPMVAGVGPIVGEGVLGFFVDPDSVVNTWRYKNGASIMDSFVLTQVESPYRLISPDPPVAVITDDRTASSGEATAIAFRGRPDARSFGQPTYGVSTANRGFALSDGASIFLTVSTMADRTGKLYGYKLPPDELVAGEKTGDPATDLPLAAAMTWLLAHAACTVN